MQFHISVLLQRYPAGPYRSFMFLCCCSFTLTWSFLQFHISVVLQLYSYPDPYCSFIFLWYCSCTLILVAIFIFLCYLCWTLTLILFSVFMFLCHWSCTYSYPNPFFSVMFLCCCSCTRSWLCPAFSSSIPPPAWISRYGTPFRLPLNGRSRVIFASMLLINESEKLIWFHFLPSQISSTINSAAITLALRFRDMLLKRAAC